MLSWLVSSGLSLSIVLRTGTKRDLSSPPWSVTNYEEPKMHGVTL